MTKFLLAIATFASILQGRSVDSACITNRWSQSMVLHQMPAAAKLSRVSAILGGSNPTWLALLLWVAWTFSRDVKWNCNSKFSGYAIYFLLYVSQSNSCLVGYLHSHAIIVSSLLHLAHSTWETALQSKKQLSRNVSDEDSCITQGTNIQRHLGGRHSTAVAFKLCAPAAQVRFSAPDIFSMKKCWDSMTAALLSWWTVPRLNSHSNPSSTSESSAEKNHCGSSFS